MSLPHVIGSLAQEFKWPHDFWRRMGWRELNAWIGVLHDLRTAERDAVERARSLAEQKAAADEAVERMRRMR